MSSNSCNIISYKDKGPVSIYSHLHRSLLYGVVLFPWPLCLWRWCLLGIAVLCVSVHIESLARLTGVPNKVADESRLLAFQNLILLTLQILHECHPLTCLYRIKETLDKDNCSLWHFEFLYTHVSFLNSLTKGVITDDQFLDNVFKRMGCQG